MVRLFTAYGLVFLLGAVPMVEAYVIVPVGVLGGLSPVLALAAGIAGNVLTVLVVVLFMDRYRRWRERRRKQPAAGTKRSERAARLFQKYGVPGLALLGPLIVGSHLAAFLAVTLGGTKRAAFLWVAASIVFWAILTTLLVHFGLDLTGKSGGTFLRKYLEGD
ncbi:small multi-drug export protein [Bhargavaea ullalensis]|uniref:Membrane protein n=1 Tax=Bhargavaea ullalensis TaxID=1265685 RepID=A0ABV2G7L1_9BACL